MEITVFAEWDPDAKVWVATSNDVPGFVAEAPTVESLRAKVELLIPELLDLNDSTDRNTACVPLTLICTERHDLRIA